jgi:hypothetical protein
LSIGSVVTFGWWGMLSVLIKSLYVGQGLLIVRKEWWHCWAWVDSPGQKKDILFAQSKGTRWLSGWNLHVSAGCPSWMLLGVLCGHAT